MFNRILNYPDIGLLIFRLAVGGAMAFAHGVGKLPPPEQLVQGVGGMGFPLPFVFAWLATLSEFAGGLCIMIGLWTRCAAFFLGVTMSVAFFIAHAADPFAKKELAFLYLIACVMLLLVGAGKYSIDRKLGKS